MIVSTIWGLMGATLLLIAAGLKWTGARSWSLAPRFIWAALLAILAWIPVQGMLINEYLRGGVGDLSVASLALLVVAVYWLLCGQKPLAEQGRTSMLTVIAVAGLALYPFALGLSPWDSYRLGFQPWLLSGVLFGLTLWSIHRRYWIMLLWLLATVASYLLGAMESNNLWDYWIDPLAVFYAWFIMIVRGGRSLFVSRRAAAQ